MEILFHWGGVIFALLFFYGIKEQSLEIIIFSAPFLFGYVWAITNDIYIGNKVDKIVEKGKQKYKIPFNYEEEVELLYTRYKDKESEKGDAEALKESFEAVRQVILHFKKNRDGIIYIDKKPYLWYEKHRNLYRVLPDHKVQIYNWYTKNWVTTEETTISLESEPLNEIITEYEAYNFISETKIK